MVAGWGNIVSGLLLRGYKKNSSTVIIAVGAVCLQAVGLSGWTFWVQRRRAKYIPKPSWAKAADDDSFALSTSDDENDNEGDNEAEDDTKETARLKGHDSFSLDEK